MMGTNFDRPSFAEMSADIGKAACTVIKDRRRHAGRNYIGVGSHPKSSIPKGREVHVMDNDTGKP